MELTGILINTRARKQIHVQAYSVYAKGMWAIGCFLGIDTSLLKRMKELCYMIMMATELGYTKGVNEDIGNDT